MLELVAAMQRLAATPATGRDHLAVNLGDVVRPIRDEAAIRSEEIAQCTVDLLSRVERLAQSTHGRVDEPSDSRNIGVDCEAEARRRLARDRGIEERRPGKQREVDGWHGWRVVARRERTIEPEHVVPVAELVPDSAVGP